MRVTRAPAPVLPTGPDAPMHATPMGELASAACVRTAAHTHARSTNVMRSWHEAAALARDTGLSGDTIEAENCYQQAIFGEDQGTNSPQCSFTTGSGAAGNEARDDMGRGGYQGWCAAIVNF
jgi:hypothetical protein